MKAIIIAAGMSRRLYPLTKDTPKCLLPVFGKPILQNTLELLNKYDVSDISLVTGYLSEKLNNFKCTKFYNDDYENNNILHSLFYARSKMVEALNDSTDIIISYSDIWFNEDVLKSLMNANRDISIVTDIEWKKGYQGRSDAHPLSEAENAIIKNGEIVEVGKGLASKINLDNDIIDSEFIGLWKLTPKGIRDFIDVFDEVNSTLDFYSPFQRANEWQKSYITDLFQEMIDRNYTVSPVLVRQGWKEFDTIDDYSRQLELEKVKTEF